jgi:hypothetical protein
MALHVPVIQVKQEIKQETGFDSETDSNCDSDAETGDEEGFDDDEKRSERNKNESEGDEFENPLDGMDEDANFLALTRSEKANLAQEEQEDEEEKKQSQIRCRALIELMSEYKRLFRET